MGVAALSGFVTQIYKILVVVGKFVWTKSSYKGINRKLTS